MAGIIISTVVITGGLIVGDSVTYSLQKIALNRLGSTTQTLTSGDRFFTTELAESTGGVPMLQLEGTAVADGGTYRLNKVQVFGINKMFNRVAGFAMTDSVEGTKVAIGFNTAQRLNLNIGDQFLLRLEKASMVPRNAPFVSEEGQFIGLRVTVVRVLGKEAMGAFNMRNSQTAPFNVFIDLNSLQERVELKNRINTVLYLSDDDVETLLAKHWTPADAGLNINKADTEGKLEITSERVFLEQPLLDAFSSGEVFFTYFVNAIASETAITPYSFISSASDMALKDDEIIINRWLANDLKAGTGDSILLKYFTVGPLRTLTEDSCRFIIKSVESMSGRFADPGFMPDIPGLSDAGSCSDWETGVPVKLDAIRDKDETYWDEYKGAPKGFISLQKAQALWGNRFGVATMVQVKTDTSGIIENFRKSLEPGELGFQVNQVLDNAMHAASNGVDFSQLFIGLSFFILLSGIILIVILLSFHIKKRAGQTGTLMALGISVKQIKRMLFFETALTGIFGAAAGVMLAILYNKAVFHALNKVWNDIVRTRMLEIHIDPLTLLTGFVISLVVAFITAYFSISYSLKKQVTAQQRNIREDKSRMAAWLTILAWILTLGSVFVLIYHIWQHGISGSSMFFVLGTLLLIGLILLFNTLLLWIDKKPFLVLNYRQLSLKNMVRNRGRSISVVSLFALGTFIVISTGLNRKDMTANADSPRSGTGGFLFFAETTLPVLSDMNANKQELDLPAASGFIQFRKADGDDASCLNLNRISTPSILGLDPQKLEGKFSFVTKDSAFNAKNPWQSLNIKMKNNVVPAIADQTVILWGLGLEIGDTLHYQTETGITLKLKLVGGLANSVFQGYVLISNENFLKYFPSSSGSKVILIDGNTESTEEINNALNFTFRDYGITVESTVDKLNDFYSIENTYLAIFLMLGIIGLIFGIVGLGIVLVKSMFERKNEIALMISLGIKRRHIALIIAREYMLLLFYGLIAGLLAAIVATLPSLYSAGTEVSLATVLWVLVILVFSGICIILLSAFSQLKPNRLLVGLRYE